MADHNIKAKLIEVQRILNNLSDRIESDNIISYLEEHTLQDLDLVYKKYLDDSIDAFNEAITFVGVFETLVDLNDVIDPPDGGYAFLINFEGFAVYFWDSVNMVWEKGSYVFKNGLEENSNEVTLGGEIVQATELYIRETNNYDLGISSITKVIFQDNKYYISCIFAGNWTIIVLDDTFNQVFQYQNFNNMIRDFDLNADGTLIAVGMFTTYDGLTHNRAVKLDTDGTVDATFDTGTGFNAGSGPFTNVQNSKVIILGDASVIICGQFTDYNGIDRRGLIRLNQDGTLFGTFNNGTGIQGGSQIAWDIAVQTNGKVVFVGNFTTFNGTATNNSFIGRLNSDGTLDLTFDPTVNFYGDMISVITRPDDKIIAGGFRSQLFQLNADGTPDAGFNGGFNYTDNKTNNIGDHDFPSLELLPSGDLVVGGKGNFVDEPTVRYLIKVGTDGEIISIFNTLFNDRVVTTFTDEGGNYMLVFGNFSEYDGIEIHDFAELEADTGDLIAVKKGIDVVHEKGLVKYKDNYHDDYDDRTLIDKEYVDKEFISKMPLGEKWESQSAAEQNQWNDAEYGNGVFIAVSSSGTNRAMYSQDGAIWKPGTGLIANSWRSVSYGNGIFVALSANGAKAATSVDGETWTMRDLPEDSFWWYITYGNGQFVAVATSGTSQVLTSPDGINWTAQTAAEANQWNGVVFGNGIFVAVSASGTNRVMTSSDGITWTSRTAAEQNQWRSIIYGNGVFVAVSSNGTNRVMISTDGITWTPVLVELSLWWRVRYGNGIFVAIAYSGTNRVMVSRDGANWEIKEQSEVSQWRGLAYGNGIFVAVADNGTNRVMKSGSIIDPRIGNNWKWSGDDVGVENHSELNLDDGTNPHGTTKGDVGLGAVDNTSDSDKPVSTAQQAALDAKVDDADKASQAEAEAGSDDIKWMTPLKTSQAIDSQVDEVNFSADDFVDDAGTLKTVKGAKDSTGNLLFDRNLRRYGTKETPITSDLVTGAGPYKVGSKVFVLHASDPAPTFDAKMEEDIVSDTYSTDVNSYNVIRIECVDDTSGEEVFLYSVKVIQWMASSLLMWFEFEEGSGATAGDSTGHNNDGSIVNSGAAAWVTGQIGTALGLSDATPDPPNDPYIQVPTSASLQGITTAFTIAFWARRDVVDGSGVIMDNEDGTTSQGILVNILSTGSRPEFYLNFAIEGSTYRVRAGSADGITSTFKHYCCTYDGSNLILYVDGVSNNSLGSIPAIDVQSDSDWFIAIEHDLTSPPDYIELDDFRVYNRALTPTEVTDLFNLG